MIVINIMLSFILFFVLGFMASQLKLPNRIAIVLEYARKVNFFHVGRLKKDNCKMMIKIGREYLRSSKNSRRKMFMSVGRLTNGGGE